MRKEIDMAIRDFIRDQGVLDWAGKTRRQFWGWYHTAADNIRAMAEGDAEAAEVSETLLDILADTPYQGPDDQLDMVIELVPADDAQLGMLNLRLADLRLQMHRILEHDPKDQMDAFASIADEILADAGEHREHVWSSLQCILRDSGLIPGDEEPCAEA